MITLEYDSMNGLALPEGTIKDFVDQYIVDYRDKDVHLIYSQELILDYFMLAVVRGELDHSTIQVKYDNEIVGVDQKGYLDRWILPNYTMEVLNEICDWRNE